MGHAGVDSLVSFIDRTGLGTASIEEQRRFMAEAAASVPAPDGVASERGVLGGRPAEWLVPVEGRGGGIVLYLHGGGYCTGSLDTHRDLGGRIALAAGCRVVLLDYRLAPEHPLPAGRSDAIAAYRELLDRGFPPEGIGIAGDSAGGGLTVATLLALREDGVPLPGGAACLSPWVDLTLTAPSFDAVGELDPMVTKAGLGLFAESYLHGADPRDPRASPLFADDLGGLPPIRIDVGEREILLDDSVGLAERIRAAGGDVTLARWAEMIHVFQAFAGPLDPEAGESVAEIGEFFAGHLRVSGNAPTGG